MTLSACPNAHDGAGLQQCDCRPVLARQIESMTWRALTAELGIHPTLIMDWLLRRVLAWQRHKELPVSRPDFSDASFRPATFDPFAPPPRRSRKGCWIAVIALCVVGVVCCGGLPILVGFGLNLVTVEVADLLRDNPKMQEHIGEIQTFEMDFSRSMLEEDEDTFHYRVKGTKGEGQIAVKHITNADGDEEILSAELRKSDGQTVQIVP